MTDYRKTNNIIYEFMGGELILNQEVNEPKGTDNILNVKRWSIADGVPINKKIYAENGYFEYHHSYDWLMPVVVKCLEKQGDFRWINTFDTALISCDIKKLYSAVIKYINYYNTLKELEDNE